MFPGLTSLKVIVAVLTRTWMSNIAQIRLRAAATTAGPDPNSILRSSPKMILCLVVVFILNELLTDCLVTSIICVGFYTSPSI